MTVPAIVLAADMLGFASMFGPDTMLSRHGQRCLPRDDGRGWDYFPFGSWGAGYRIGATERNRLCNIRRLMACFQLAVVAILGVVVVLHYSDHDLIGGVWVSAAFLATLGLDRLVSRVAVRQLSPTDRRLTATEIYATKAQPSLRGDSGGTVRLVMFVAAMVFLVGSGALSSCERGQWFMVPIFLLSLVCFVAFLFDELAAFWISRRLRGEGPARPFR
jgi:hypothetical protein